MAVNGTVKVSSEAPAAKKAKKEKPAVADTNVSVLQDESEEKKSSKTGVNGNDEGASALAKAERKALKKARKEAEKAASREERGDESREVPETAEKEVDGAIEAGSEKSSNKILAKAAKKAEKERRKALKKTAKSEASTSTVNGSSNEYPLTGYEQAPSLTALPKSDIDDYLSSKQITITDDHAASHSSYRPILNFSQLPNLDEAERAPFKSFSSPTPIQAAAWPYLLAGRDLVGVAETGSGKTLAFGVPCMRYIKSLPKKRREGVQAVIVSPTRELALQIHEQLEKLATPAGLSAVCIYGGVPKYEQITKIRKAHIVVATPGRLNDLLDGGDADLSSAGYVVLDEADRMLDVGFEEAIRKIISSTAPKRQTLMFTATWPQSIRDLAATFMKEPVRIIIGDNPDGELRANVRIQQIVEVVQPNDKNYRLLQLLKEHQSGKKKSDRILVFCLYKKEAARVEQFLAQKGFSVAGIHGDLSQESAWPVWTSSKRAR